MDAQTHSEPQAASVLVVDDNALSARKLAMTVRALGHEAATAGNGAEALRLLREHGFDLVLLDIVMPRVDGFEVLRAMQADAALRDLPVIVVSSLEGEADSVARALELGAEDFLPKSYDLTILKARLNSSLLKKRLRDRELAYLQDVETLTRAARVIEAGPFRPAELDIGAVAARPDQLGRLAAVLGQLTQVIYEREQQSDLRTRTLWGIIMVIVAGSLFATGPALGRKAIEIGAGPLQTALWTNLAGGALCVVVALHRGALARLRWPHLRFCLAWAAVYGVGYQAWLTIVAAHVEASMIALVSSARAFMVFTLAAFIALEKPSLRRLLGLGLGLAAVIIVLGAQGALGGGGSNAWLLAALGLPALLSVHTLMMTGRPRDLDPFAATALTLWLAGGGLALAAVLTGETMMPGAGGSQLAMVILSRGLAAGLAIALALEIVARAGAVFASQMAYIQTFAGIGWGMILLDERLPPAAWGALALIVAGFLLIQPKQAGEEFSITIPMDRHSPRR